MTRTQIADWLLYDSSLISAEYLQHLAAKFERMRGHWPTEAEVRDYVESGDCETPNFFVQRLRNGMPLTSKPFERDEPDFLAALGGLN